MRGIYANDVLMERSVGINMSNALYDFVKAYLFQAHCAYQRGLTHFALLPKLHSLHEIAHSLKQQCGRSPWCINPAVHTCSMDEDFIGRCAAVSRLVSPRAIERRVLQRYLAHIQFAWARTYEGQERWKVFLLMDRWLKPKFWRCNRNNLILNHQHVKSIPTKNK